MTQAPQSPLRDSYEALFERAHNAFRAGDVEGAIALYRRLVSRLARLNQQVLQRRPDLGDMHRIARLELSGMLSAQGRYAEAIEVEEVLLETHPDEANVWRTDLAVLRCAKGEVDAGLSELRLLTQEEPESPWLWLIMGREARLAGRLAESEAALEQALTVCGEDCDAIAETHYQLFHLFKDKGQRDRAVAAWESAARYEDRVSERVREVYTMLTEAGLYSQALQFVEQDENEMQALFQRGLIAELTGDHSRALAYWQDVSALNPNDFEYGHDAWVEAMLRLRQPRPALEWLGQHLPFLGTRRLFVLAGIGWAMEGDGDLAAQVLRQAIHLFRHDRPLKEKLDSADWRLLDSLVTDQSLKAPLKRYFAVIDTPWDAVQAKQPQPAILRL